MVWLPLPKLFENENQIDMKTGTNNLQDKKYEILTFLLRKNTLDTFKTQIIFQSNWVILILYWKG